MPRTGPLFGLPPLLLVTAAASTDPPQVKEVAGKNRPTPLLTLRGHTQAVNAVQYSPDGKRLATASSDTTAALWDASTGKRLLSLRGHTDSVRDLAFAPDGTLLATAGYDNAVRVWDAATGRSRLTLPGHPDGVSAVAFSPCGRYLASGGGLGSDQGGEVVVRDVRTGKQAAVLRSPGAAVGSLAYSGDGRRLATGLWGGEVVIWELAGTSRALTLRGRGSPGVVWGVAFSGDQQRLASGSSGGVVRIWALPRGGEATALTGHRGNVSAVAFSPNGRVLASAATHFAAAPFGGEVILWYTRTGQGRRAMPWAERE